MEKLEATVIIPVHNEEKTIKEVVKTVLKSRLFCQVIVVNDGSTNGSGKILKSFGKKISLIQLSKNQGKGAALAQGVTKAKGKIVAFIDADATNMDKKYLLPLLQPFRNNNISASIGWPTKIGQAPQFFQGERAYRRENLLPYLKNMEAAKGGIEVFLDELAKQKKWRVKHVSLRGLHKLLKFDKTGFGQETLKNYLKEALEMAEQVAKIQKKTAQEKLALQKKILQKMLKNYLIQSRKMIEKVLISSKNFKKLKELLK